MMHTDVPPRPEILCLFIRQCVGACTYTYSRTQHANRLVNTQMHPRAHIFPSTISSTVISHAHACTCMSVGTHVRVGAYVYVYTKALRPNAICATVDASIYTCACGRARTHTNMCGLIIIHNSMRPQVHAKKYVLIHMQNSVRPQAHLQKFQYVLLRTSLKLVHAQRPKIVCFVERAPKIRHESSACAQSARNICSASRLMWPSEILQLVSNVLHKF